MLLMYLLLCLLSCSAIAVQETADQAQDQSCGFNQTASILADRIIHHPQQQRSELNCNSLLSQIAQDRAESMALHEHDPEITPNQIVIKQGFRFPSFYPVTGNQVEAVAEGTTDPDQALRDLINSDKHKDHILGMGEFFSRQQHIGVGYYSDQDPTNKDQWVVLIAESYQSPKVVFKQEFTMPIKIAQGCDTDWKNSTDEFLKRKCSKLSDRKNNHKLTQPKLKCDAKSCVEEDES